MMRIAVLFTLFGLAGTLMAQKKAEKVDWVEVVGEKSSYKAKFPGKPQEMGNQGARQHVLEADAGKTAFISAANLLPVAVDITNKDVVKTTFDNGLKGLKNSLKEGKISAEKQDVFKKKYPMYVVRMEVPELGIYLTKWYLTESAFIQMTVLGPKEVVDGETAKKFFDSFDIPEGKKEADKKDPAKKMPPEKQKPTTVTGDEKSYTVTFPGKPREQNAGDAKQFLFETNGGKTAYLSQVNLFPAAIDLTDKKLVKETFDNALMAVQNAFKKAKVISDKTSEYAKKYPMREIDLDMQELGIYRTRWIITSQGFVQLTVLAPNKEIDNDEAKEFFKSLKFSAD